MEAYFGQRLQPEFWRRVEQASCILLHGGGGGYDFMNGLPLYFALSAMGKSVHISSMSFSQMDQSDGEVLVRDDNPNRSLVCLAVDHSETSRANRYFPEKYLSQWFHSIGQEVKIYVMLRRGIKKITATFNLLKEMLGIDLIICLDGGSDSLMAGDEFEMGKGIEDIISLFGIRKSKIDCIHACLGIGVNSHNGVSTASSLRAISEITSQGGFLGSFSLTAEMPEVKGFSDAFEFVHARMPRPSIAYHYIASALRGKYGDFHEFEATQPGPIYINPICSQFYFFDLKILTKRILYREYISATSNVSDLMVGLNYYRENYPIREKEEILPTRYP